MTHPGPSHVRHVPRRAALTFAHPTDLSAAAVRAERFAGPGGRMASLPDIIDARLASEPGAPAWDCGFATSSAEYVGLSSGGTPLIVVAHGLGPLVDPSRTDEPAVAAGADGEWRVSRESFQALLDGFYGPVAILELGRVLRRRKHYFLEIQTYGQACDDPLVRARLGRRCGEYLEKQRDMSRAWLRERFMDTRSNECVLSQRDPDRTPYPCTDVADAPMAHPLSVSPLLIYDHGHWCGSGMHESLVTELHCYERGDPARVVGIRGPVTMADAARASARRR